LFTRPLLPADRHTAVTVLVPVRLDNVRGCHAENVQAIQRVTPMSAPPAGL
jgi:hypothetical protein